MVLLTAENIRKSYGTRVIFDDISFSIHEGDKIGVIGKWRMDKGNGCLWGLCKGGFAGEAEGNL